MDIDITELRKKRRPLWMTPFGQESFAQLVGAGGDIWSDRLWPEWNRMYGEEFYPNVDFYEKEGKYFLSVEIPGCQKDDLNVTIRDRVLTIQGKKGEEREEKGASYYLRETRCGSFSRSLNLPEEVDEDKVEAKFKDGVLTLEMPRKEGQVGKRITVA